MTDPNIDPKRLRYESGDLIVVTTQLFERAGLDGPIATAVAEILVEADLLGYTTHWPAVRAGLSG